MIEALRQQQTTGWKMIKKTKKNSGPGDKDAMWVLKAEPFTSICFGWRGPVVLTKGVSHETDYRDDPAA